MSNTRIGKILKDKFESIGTSTRTSGRYTSYITILGEKLGLGSQVGKNLLLTKETYPRITASIFEKGIFLNYWNSKSTGVLAGFIPVKTTFSRRPSLKSFTISNPTLDDIDKFKFNGKNFINMTNFNSSKELIDRLSSNDVKQVVNPSLLVKEVVKVDTELKSSKYKDDSIGKSKWEKEVDQNPQDLLQLSKELYNILRSESKVYMSREPSLDGYNPYSDKRLCATFELRSWGVWEVPDDEEDDGDYDWNVLNTRWRSKLDSIMEKYNSKYKNIKFEYGLEEKDWMSVMITFV